MFADAHFLRSLTLFTQANEIDTELSLALLSFAFRTVKLLISPGQLESINRNRNRKNNL